MRTHLRILALGLSLTLALGLLVGCGSTGQTGSSAETASDPLVNPRISDAMPPGGTTDPGSRYAGGTEPFGAIAVESDPLANPTGAFVPVEADWRPDAAAETGTSIDLGPPPTTPVPAANLPRTGSDGRREYRAPAPPPPPSGGGNRWTTPAGGR